MKATTSTFDLKKYFPEYILDILALTLVYFIPSLSHLAGIPFYLFEPMRIFVILSLLHSNKVNSYMLALALPLFSFMISSHPVFLKAMLISFELLLNVFLYYVLISKKIPNYGAVVLSVISSKLMYYLFKFIFIQFAWLDSGLISTPLYIQLFTTIVFGVYAYFFWIRKRTER